MFERFTDQARRVVVVAQEESRKLGHDYIGTEHILLGILGAGESVAVQALASLGVSLEAAREQVEEIVGRGSHRASGHIPFTPRAKKVLELSLREAIQLGHNYIGTEHILLGLIREGEGVAAQVLTRLGADLNRTRQQVIQLLHGPQAAQTLAEYNRPFRRPGGPGGLDAIRDRLDTIAGQLAAIVGKLGIGGEMLPAGPAQRPAALRQLDERIARIGREKQVAIDAQEFERAVTLRNEEQELLRQRDDENSRWMAAAGERPAGADGAELDRMRRVIDNLQAQLRRHGIEPDPEGKIGPDPAGQGKPDPQDQGGPDPEGKIGPDPEGQGKPDPAGHGSPTPQAKASPTPQATASPTPQARASPTPQARASPTPQATASPTPKARASPTPKARASPTPKARASPTPKARASPSLPPTRPDRSPEPRPTKIITALGTGPP